MASYVESTLLKGEQVQYVGRISLWSLLGYFVLGFVFIWFWFLGAFFWIAALIRYVTTELAVTNKRVIAKFGFVSRRTVELNISKVESIQVDQSVLGRLFNYGSLVISGAGAPQAPIPGISNPMQFRRAFMEAQDRSGAPVEQPPQPVGATPARQTRPNPAPAAIICGSCGYQRQEHDDGLVTVCPKCNVPYLWGDAPK